MRSRNKSILISPVCTEITNAINELGINTIFSECIDNLITYERFHADMQLLKIKDRFFIPKNAIGLLKKLSEFSNEVCVCDSLENKYPLNVSLNAVQVGQYLFCKASSLAPEVREFSIANDIKLINVNQGYAKCSTLVLNDNAIITADPTICKAAYDLDLDVLLIKQGHIYLDDNSYGFIGGASGVIGDTVIFFGDLESHPDASDIKEFIKKHNMDLISLCKGCLKDIGGFVLLN
ncbi:MAG: hypothetical protein IJA62_01795 [Ruminococcus sp.]|nr:hypothetical protein [Ruminococcus sp.]